MEGRGSKGTEGVGRQPPLTQGNAFLAALCHDGTLVDLDLLLHCFMKGFSQGNFKKKASCGSSEHGGELGSCPDPSLGASGPDLWI